MAAGRRRQRRRRHSILQIQAGSSERRPYSAIAQSPEERRSAQRGGRHARHPAQPDGRADRTQEIGAAVDGAIGGANDAGAARAWQAPAPDPKRDGLPEAKR